MNQMHEPTVHEARNAWIVARPLLCWIVTMVFLCLLLALLGAVNSYDVPIVVRLAYWGGLFAVALFFSIGIEAALLRGGMPLDPLWRWAGLFTLLLGVAMTPVAYVANSSGGWAPLSMFVQHFSNSLLISAASVAMRIALGRIVFEPPATKAEGSEGPVLVQRLSPGMQQADLLAIEADGHYIRVHTGAGSEMVLMRLKDAIGETSGLEGIQVHRSWWIARSAIRDIRSKAGSTVLCLANGLEVPVSRARRRELRDRGMLER